MHYQTTFFLPSVGMWIRIADLERIPLLSKDWRKAPPNYQIRSQTAQNPVAAPMPHLWKLLFKDWS